MITLMLGILGFLGYPKPIIGLTWRYTFSYNSARFAGTLAGVPDCMGLLDIRGKVGRGYFFDFSIFRARLTFLLYSTVSWSKSLEAMMRAQLDE